MGKWGIRCVRHMLPALAIMLALLCSSSFAEAGLQYAPADGGQIMVPVEDLAGAAGISPGGGALRTVDKSKKIYESKKLVLKVYGSGSGLISSGGGQFIRTPAANGARLALVIVKDTGKGIRVLEFRKVLNDDGSCDLTAGPARSMNSLPERMDLAFVSKSVKLSPSFRRTLTAAGRLGISASSSSMQVDRGISGGLKSLWKAARTRGYSLLLVSGYRSVDKQKTLYDARVTYFASREVMVPGYSEHHTGRAVDVVSYSKPSLSSFTGSREASWLAANAHRYGFIVRYPADKTSVTGIIYEPWHLRHVGVMYATHMKSRGIVFDELYRLSRSGVIVSGGGKSAYFVSLGKGRPATVRGDMDKARYKRYLMSDGYEGYEISLD